ncbi:MAG TPA: Type 1 glutamine amidotransferase-like domain-containing protein [archaeon]|nr:Type 1 glutamine amidotransferase-like domain-containing protein [archaeon]
MKFYLSSYKIGNEPEKLKQLVSNGKIGYISNALDFSSANKERRKKHIESDITDLRNLGLEVELLDLKAYFGKQSGLKKKIDKLGEVFVSGGNTFVLRQAMKLSGFDKIFKQLVKRKDFLYAGYSAGICVLAPDLKALKIVDDPKDKPYRQVKQTIWKGLGFLDYIILPHYKSNHPESADIDKEVEYCKKNKIPFKTLRDGEVIIIK